MIFFYISFCCILCQKLADDIEKEEQERLDEILLICSQYEKQNQTPSPIVQNRIKTNGSLPRDSSKNKSPNGMNLTFEFPEVVKKRISEYENIDRRTAVNNGNGLSSSFNEQNTVEYEIASKKMFVPQSPRNRIKTYIPSPKLNVCIETAPSSKAAEYDAIIKSFEEKLKVEIQLLQEKKHAPTFALSGTTFEEKQKERDKVLCQVRHIKTLINDLENQQEEVQKEMEMERALVNAELEAEDSILKSFHCDLMHIQNNLQRSETQRKSNRVMQETNQFRLKQNIDVKQEHKKRLENLLENDETLLSEHEKIIEELENDRKVFEDLEFQYLEEETEW